MSLRRTRQSIILVLALNAAAAPATFDVASVKLSKAPDAVVFVSGGMMDSGMGRYRVPSVGGNVNIGNWTLAGLIAAAWDLGPGQLSGPAWLNSDRYDVAAKTLPQTSQAELRIMLQSLLMERFNLATHRESKEMAAYALVVAKNGPKLHPATADQRMPVLFAPPAKLIGQGSTMQVFALALGHAAGRPVVDETSVGGTYDFSLSWSPETANIRPAEGENAAVGDTRPSIFTALQEQMGLRLEPRRTPVEILVVDHAERIPAAN